jgi:hypothetical protein
MKDRSRILQEIESRYDINSIKVMGESFWPYIRLLIFSELYSGIIQVHKKDYTTPVRKLRNATRGLFHWWKKWDYVFFSNDLERKVVDGRIIDKLTEYANELVGYEKALYVEQVEKNHLNQTHYGRKKVASFDFILIVTGITKIFNRSFRNIQIDNEELLIRVLSEFDLSVPYRQKLEEFFLKVTVLRFLFKITKPKAVFITDYGMMPVVYAARSIGGINVIEFQHGVIGMAHQYYHPAVALNPKFCPEFLFAFGTYDAQSLAHGNYVTKEKIFPVGNFYLDTVMRLPSRKEITSIQLPFQKSVCVPTDRVTHVYLKDFIIDVAKKLPEVIFIIVPRNTSYLDKEDKNLPKNVYLEKFYSFQEVVRHCTYNSCTNSTCCLEALTLGVPNILIDEDGLVSSYYGNVLTNQKTTKFARNKEEYIELVRDFEPVSREEITYSNMRNFMPNYQENLQNALKRIVL